MYKEMYIRIEVLKDDSIEAFKEVEEKLKELTVNFDYKISEFHYDLYD